MTDTNKEKELFNREEYLKGVIKNGVDLRLKKDAALTAISCNVDAAAEKLGCTTTYLRKLIDLEYFKTYDPEKFETQLTFLEFLEDVTGHFEEK